MKTISYIITYHNFLSHLTLKSAKTKRCYFFIFILYRIVTCLSKVQSKRFYNIEFVLVSDILPNSNDSRLLLCLRLNVTFISLEYIRNSRKRNFHEISKVFMYLFNLSPYYMYVCMLERQLNTC